MPALDQRAWKPTRAQGFLEIGRRDCPEKRKKKRITVDETDATGWPRYRNTLSNTQLIRLLCLHKFDIEDACVKSSWGFFNNSPLEGSIPSHKTRPLTLLHCCRQFHLSTSSTSRDYDQWFDHQPPSFHVKRHTRNAQFYKYHKWTYMNNYGINCNHPERNCAEGALTLSIVAYIDPSRPHLLSCSWLPM